MTILVLILRKSSTMQYLMPNETAFDLRETGYARLRERPDRRISLHHNPRPCYRWRARQVQMLVRRMAASHVFVEFVYQLSRTLDVAPDDHGHYDRRYCKANNRHQYR
jgi:hypothetical protein